MSQPSAPAAIPEKFLVAKRAIDSSPATDEIYSIATKDFTAQDRVEFNAWYLSINDQEQAEIAARQSKEPQVKVAKFLQDLKSLDPKSETSIDSFTANFDTDTFRPAAELIRVATQDKHLYYLSLEMTYFDVSVNKDIQAKDIHPSIFEFKSSTGTPSLKYGLCIGQLRYTVEGGSMNTSTASPLHFFLDPRDKSIWLVTDTFFVDAAGDPYEPQDPQNGWRWCGLAQKDRQPQLWDMVRIYTAQQVKDSNGQAGSTGLGGGMRELLDQGALATARATGATAFTAKTSDVLTYIGASSGATAA